MISTKDQKENDGDFVINGFTCVRSYAEDYYDGAENDSKNYERSSQEENSNLRDYEYAY